jgi:hypothetical protein
VNYDLQGISPIGSFEGVNHKRELIKAKVSTTSLEDMRQGIWEGKGRRESSVP